MPGSAAQAPRTLFREPQYIHCSNVLYLTLNLDQWQRLRVCGVAVFGRPILVNCNFIRIETFDEILIAHGDEVEGLGPANT